MSQKHSEPSTKDPALIPPETSQWLYDTDEVKYYEGMGYIAIAKIHGEVVGLRKFMFTTAIVVGMEPEGFKCRYCYPDFHSAFIAFVDWFYSGDEEPEGYIKRKGL